MSTLRDGCICGFLLLCSIRMPEFFELLREIAQCP